MATIASLATCSQVSVSSDRAETRPVLLTGGLLVRVQPEEPKSAPVHHDFHLGLRIDRRDFTQPAQDCGPVLRIVGREVEDDLVRFWLRRSLRTNDCGAQQSTTCHHKHRFHCHPPSLRSWILRQLRGTVNGARTTCRMTALTWMGRSR